MKRLFLLIFIFFFFLCSPAWGATYYVSEGGSDTAPYDTWAKASTLIATINALSLSNDDEVHLRPGDTFDDATLTLNGTSAAVSGIVVKGMDGDGRTIAGDGLPLLDGNFNRPIYIDHALVNLTLQDIDVSGWNVSNTTRCEIRYVNGLTIDGVDFDGHAGANTFAAIPTESEPCTYPYPKADWAYYIIQARNVDGDITIKNCVIENLILAAGFAASKTAWCKNDLHGIHLEYRNEYAGKTSGTVNIHDNTISDVYSDSIHIKHLHCTTNIYNNTCIGFGENFLDIKGSRYIDIYNNTASGDNIGKDPGVGWFGPNGIIIHDAGEEGYPYGDLTIRDNYIYTIYGDGICLNTGSGGGGNIVYGNYIKDCLLGIRVGNGANEIHDNIIETTSSVAQDPDNHYSTNDYRSAILFTGAHTTKTYHNTIYVDNSSASNGITIQNNSSGAEYKNNIIYVTNAGDFCLEWNGTGSTPTILNNLYYNPDTSNRASWDSTTYTTSTISTIDADALTGAPGFNSIGSSQFYAASDTEIIVDAGASIPEITTGLDDSSTWTPSISVSTVARPQGVGYDIGAYEYEPDSPGPPPVGDFANYTLWTKCDAADFSGNNGTTEYSAGDDTFTTQADAGFAAGSAKQSSNGIDSNTGTTAGYVTLDVTAEDLADDECSAAFWFRTPSLPASGTTSFFKLYDDSDNYFMLGIRSTGALIIYSVAATVEEHNTLSSAGIISVDTWYFIEVRYDDNTNDDVLVDVDNVNVISVTDQAMTDLTFTAIRWGQGTGSNIDFDIDSVRMSTDYNEDFYAYRDTINWPSSDTTRPTITDLGWWDSATGICVTNKSITYSTSGDVIPLCLICDEYLSIEVPGTETTPSLTVKPGPKSTDTGTAVYAGYDNTGATTVIKLNYTTGESNRSTDFQANATSGFSLGQGSSIAITTITKSNPGNPGIVTTAAAHGLSTDNYVYFNQLGEMTEIEDNCYQITVIDSTSFSICDTSGHTNAEADGGNEECFKMDSYMVDPHHNMLNPTLLDTDLGDIVLEVPGIITIGTIGDYPLWSNGSTGFHDLSYDVDKDRINVLDAHTDDYIISADDVRIRGTGGNVAITGGIELTGDRTIIKCLTFSGGITDNGNDYVYQETCHGQMID